MDSGDDSVDEDLLRALGDSDDDEEPGGGEHGGSSGSVPTPAGVQNGQIDGEWPNPGHSALSRHADCFVGNG
jgi:hypothetical protein